MTRIVVSRRTLSDFKRIWRYIAVDSEPAADRLLLAMDDRLRLLGSFPEIGARRDDLRPGARMLVHGRYLILYSFERARDRVKIVAIVEGLRDLTDLF